MKYIFKKALSILITLCLVLTLPPPAAFAAAGTPVTYELELRNAIDAADSGDTIFIGDDITLTTDLEIGGKNITLTSDDSYILYVQNHTITISAEAEVTLGGKLIIEGSGGNGSPVVDVKGYGSLTLEEEAFVLQANKESGATAIENRSGGMVMITENAAVESGSNGIINDGTLLVTGGIISGSDAHCAIDNYGILTVSGGSIGSTDNDTYGILVSAGTVNITGGSIAGNNCAMHVNGTGTVNISRGTFEAGDDSSDALLCQKGTVRLNGGEFIKGRVLTGGGTGSIHVDLRGSSGLTLPADGVLYSGGGTPMPFLTALPDISSYNILKGQRSIIPLNAGVEFFVDPTTSYQLDASMVTGTTDVQMTPTEVGNYDLVLTARGTLLATNQSFKLTLPVTVSPAAANVCEMDGVGYASFDKALDDVSMGATATIKLLQDIIHTTPVMVDGKTISLELGDYDLLIDTSTDQTLSSALTVAGGGKVTLTGEGTGELNIKGAFGGVSIVGANSVAVVHNIEVTENDNAVSMVGSGQALGGGTITVKGNIKAPNGYGVTVNAKNGYVVVNGSITAGRVGVSTSTNPGTQVIVKGDITVIDNAPENQNETIGIRANGLTIVDVTGNVTVLGTDCIGVYAYGGKITVGGNVVSSGKGAKAEPNYSYGNGEVTITGSLSAGTPFITVGTIELTPSQGNSGPSGTLIYTYGKSVVQIGRVGDYVPVTKAPTPNASFTAIDFYSGTLAGLNNDMQYSVNSGRTWNPVYPITGDTMTIYNVTAGEGIWIKQQGDDITTADSDIQIIAVTQAAVPTTGLSKVDCTTAAQNDGKLIGLTKAMEYKLKDADTWIGGTGGDITGLVSGTYYVRVKATGTVLASEEAVLVILPHDLAPIPRSGGGPSTPSTPTYMAEVREGDAAETTIPVVVDKDAGTASVDAGSQKLAKRGTVITMPSIPGISIYSVGIPVPDLSTTVVQGILTLDTVKGSVTVPSNMLTGVAGISGSKAQITISQGNRNNLPADVKASIGDRPLIQLNLAIDGKQNDWSNPNAPVAVSIPYTPTAAELMNPESIVIWYVDGRGNVVTIPNGHYDATTGTVTFHTTHFSGYAVVYNKVSFNDVASGAWYSKAVNFIAAREITDGTGNGNYSPEAKMTRGEFIVLMMRAYGIAPDTNSADNFSDAGNTYYTGYLSAAKRLGITAGVGNNLYAPGNQITRQEMFTLLYNVLKAISRLPQGDSGKTLDDFSDAWKIDSWAKEAMTLLVKTGTVGGSGGKLTPEGTTTRAEMAQVLYNLLWK